MVTSGKKDLLRAAGRCDRPDAIGPLARMQMTRVQDAVMQHKCHRGACSALLLQLSCT